MGIETIAFVFVIIIAALIWRGVSGGRNRDRRSPTDPTINQKGES